MICRFLPKTFLSASQPRGPFLSGLDALAAGDGGPFDKLRRVPDSGPQPPELGAQGLMEPLPGAVPGPVAEAFVRSLPRRKVVGQHPPRAAGAQQVQDGVYHFPQFHGTGTASRLGFRQQRSQDLPLGVSQIGGAWFPFHPLMLFYCQTLGNTLLGTATPIPGRGSQPHRRPRS